MKRHEFMKIASCVTLCLVFSTVSLRAQFTSGVQGVITDPSGAVVPNASVTIRNMETGVIRNLKTSGAGFYHFGSLSAATFTITTTACGFKTLVHENVRLEAAEVKRVNVVLQLGSTATKVTVSTASLSVNLAQARVSPLVGQNMVHELPLVGRIFIRS